MKNTQPALITIAGALLITILFHRQALGLNLLLFELLTFGWLWLSKQFSFKGKMQITLGASVLLTAFATVFIYSTYAIAINLLVFFIWVGVLIYPEVKSVTNAFALAFYNMLPAQTAFFKSLGSSKLKGYNVGAYIKRTYIYFIPIIIVAIFIAIYRHSNPVFNEIVIKVGQFLQDHIFSLFENLDFLTLLTFIIGILLCSFILFRKAYEPIITLDANGKLELVRVKTQRFNQYGQVKTGPTALKNEYRAAVFLLFALNAIILVLNIIDINWVWFNFTWNGQYLKQFVHEATFLLIGSILVSIGLVLFYFRNNLNFYSKNKFLKYLSYIWLAQNAVLAVSVVIRNFWYIHYFSLAYKRIGVIVFILLTLYGLYTVFVKVKDRKSATYLFRQNTYALLIVLVVTSLFNWDVIIAKYNFNNAGRAFLHLNFMAELSDKALPYMDKPLAELEDIKRKESINPNFEFSQNSYIYLSAEDYYDRIQRRKVMFIKDWEEKSWLEWNLPEYMAYQKLKAATGNE
jgi:Domain of unknown function (DUF4173)